MSEKDVFCVLCSVFCVLTEKDREPTFANSLLSLTRTRTFTIITPTSYSAATHNAHSVGWTAKRGTGTAALPVPVLLGLSLFPGLRSSQGLKL